MERSGRSDRENDPSRIVVSVASTSAIRPAQAYAVGNIMMTRASIITDISTMLIYWLFATREPTSIAPVST